MSDQKIGAEVRSQATNSSIMNVEPVVAKAAIVGIVGAIGSILVIGGWIGEDEAQTLKDAAGELVPAVILIATILAGVWGRMSAYSPRSAAKIAVTNSEKPAGSTPTLDPPP